jgi:hypothetical protein
LRELTLGVEQFFALSVRRGQSAWCLQTVRAGAVRRVFFACSPCSCALCFRSGFALGFRCSRFADGPSFSSGRSVACADGPPVLRGRSVFLGSVLVVLFALTDGPRLSPDSLRQGCGQSAVPCRTVRAAIADSPPCLAGRSARGWQLCFLVQFLPSFFCVSACASRNRS